MTRFNPGPGTYEHLNATQTSFYTTNSKEKLDRLPKDKKRFPVVSGEKLPGPGYYSPRNQFSNRGVYIVSNNKNSLGSSFGREKRGSGTVNGRNKETPGPGTYKLQSEFGFDVSIDSSTMFNHSISNRTEYATINSYMKRRSHQMNKSYNFGDGRLRKNLFERGGESLMGGASTAPGKRKEDEENPLHEMGGEGH